MIKQNHTNNHNEKKFSCSYCNKTFTQTGSLNRHLKSCNHKKFDKILTDQIKIHDQKINQLKKKYEKQIQDMKKSLEEKYEKQIQDIREEFKLDLKEEKKYYENIIQNIIKNISSNNREDLKDIIKFSINDDKKRIEKLEKKYLKKQSRQIYEENLIYILTTERLKKDRVYIIGKTTNLTRRLSTYNKSDEHEVVFYKKCKDEESMTMAEKLVFKHLEEYIQFANRERYILPEGEDISLFSNVIEKCINFLP